LDQVLFNCLVEVQALVVRYRRVMLKLGGEALAGPSGYGIDPQKA